MQVTGGRRAWLVLAALGVATIGFNAFLVRQNGIEERKTAHDVNSGATASSLAEVADNSKVLELAVLLDKNEKAVSFSAYQQARQEYKAAASDKVFVHQALVNPTAERLRFAMLAIEACESIAYTQRYARYEALLEKLRDDWKTPWLDRARRCDAGGGIQAHQTYAVRQLLKERPTELPIAAYQHRLDGDKAQLSRVNALRDVDLAIDWGFAASMQSPELLRTNDPSVSDADWASFGYAWMLAVCERYQCAPERSADLCLRLGLCNQPDLASQIEAMQLHPDNRLRTTPEQWHALREGMRQKVADLLWKGPR